MAGNAVHPAARPRRHECRQPDRTRRISCTAVELLPTRRQLAAGLPRADPRRIQELPAAEARMIQRLSATDSGPAASQRPTVDRENPWPGLYSYDEAGKEYFKGRQEVTRELLRLVLREDLVLLYGIS